MQSRSIGELNVLPEMQVMESSATIDIDLRKCCRVITDGDDSETGSVKADAAASIIAFPSAGMSMAGRELRSRWLGTESSGSDLETGWCKRRY